MDSKSFDTVVTAHALVNEKFRSREETGHPFRILRLCRMKYIQRILNLATNSNILILISLQPDGVNL